MHEVSPRHAVGGGTPSQSQTSWNGLERPSTRAAKGDQSRPTSCRTREKGIPNVPQLSGGHFGSHLGHGTVFGTRPPPRLQKGRAKALGLCSADASGVLRQKSWG